MKRTSTKSLPTASGGIVRLAYRQARNAGVDVNALLKQAGLSVSQGTDEQLRVAARDQISFLNLAADAVKDDFLGIRLAQQAELRSLGLLYYVLASSSTLGEAFLRAARYSTINNESIRIDYRRGRTDVVSYQCVGVSRASDRHQIELFVALTLRMCRQLTGREVTPNRVRLMHARTQLPSDLKSFFGCPVDFGAQADEVILAPEVSEMPVVSADPYLNSLLEKYCEEAISGRGTKPSDWRVTVENTMTQLLPHGQATLPEVSRRLAITPRTLGRRLAAEQTSFVDVLEQLRHDLANRYLKDPERSISEIAWLLGYQQTSSFDRAFRRWAGVNPGDARARHSTAERRPNRRAR
jgi:AraC-like DNA-binding protein